MPNMLDDLKELYNKCSPEQQSIFAETVNTLLVNSSPAQMKAKSVENKEVVKPISSKITGILSNVEIEKLKIIAPYVSTKQGFPSWGQEPYGYTCRLDKKYLVHNKLSQPVDLRRKDQLLYEQREGSDVIPLSVGETIVACTMETLEMPADVQGYLWLKSTYARLGIIGHFCPVEAGYSGKLSLCITNLGVNPVLLLTDCGICQVAFFRGKTKATQPYVGSYGKNNGPEGAKG